MKIVALAAAAWLAAALHAQPAHITLAGTWNFALDSTDSGHRQKWWEKTLGPEEIYLPGSTDQAGYGTKTHGPEAGWLSRPYIYQGPAWYQREIEIPESWRGRHITLFLERAHWQTEVWVDGAALGSRNSLSTPHVYELAALEPGRHRLTICVDNSLIVDVGVRASSVTDYTQTNWNGIIGRIELQSRPPVWMESARALPDRIEVDVRSLPGARAEGEIAAAGRQVRFTESGKVDIPLPSRAAWDLLAPSLELIELRLTTAVGTDRLRVARGARSFGTRGTQFTLNGRPVFLRGTLECADFPLTGYPPADEESWDRIFRVAKSYGLNHFRFHSWCPPEAAFAAADRRGFLLQIELPVWSHRVGRDPALDEFMRAEGHRILEAYGNHPSFGMLCLGNELSGDWNFMDQLVTEFKQADPRHLYTFTDDIGRHTHGPTSDYHVTQATKAGRLRIWGSRFAKEMSGTDVDYSASVAAIPVPLIAHELGQWAVYPSYEELDEYTGLLKPRNLEAFRNQLAARGMLDQAQALQKASGRFAWSIYKEDIETTLRTPHFGGFQLLQLEDFPGQGEALIGLLDAFWNSKGILAPEEFRRFSSDTVPLLRFAGRVWTADETFTARWQVAHYGPDALQPGGRWTATSGAASLGSGPAGDIRLPLSAMRQAGRVHLQAMVPGGENDWSIWVYPKRLDMQPPKDVLIATSFDDAARRRLADGGKVVLLWPPAQPNPHLQPMSFLPVFWSLSWFPKQPGTMGIFCDPRHPALADFPTEDHSDWQWWELTESARAFILDDLPPAFRPIVQVIDDFHRNHKLGAVFEARVGAGKLLVSSFDLNSRLEERVVARQLLYSLYRYAGSDRFAPRDSLALESLEKLLRVEAGSPAGYEGAHDKEAAPWPKKR